MINIDAIYKAYPQTVSTDMNGDAWDANGNKILIDQERVDAAAIEVANEQLQRRIEKNRSISYQKEADPLFFKYQAGEVTKEEWLAKREEIRQRYPYPSQD